MLNTADTSGSLNMSIKPGALQRLPPTLLEMPVIFFICRGVKIGYLANDFEGTVLTGLYIFFLDKLFLITPNF